jgi:hypothetical protein
LLDVRLDNEFRTTYQLTAAETGRDLPAGLRVVESPVGIYAIAGDNLDAGTVELAEGGSKAEVFAQIPNGSDPPTELHVYTHGITFPPDAAIDVNVVQGEEMREIDQRVGEVYVVVDSEGVHFPVLG